MPCVEFYREERPNPNGNYLREILTWNNGALDMDHDWVQWVFPSNEMSQMNSDAPAMTKNESQIFQADPELKEKVKTSLIRILNFLGLELNENDEVQLVQETEDNPLPQWWMRGFNHTMLRVTRILKCLRLTGHQHYAISMHNALLTQKDRFSENTLGHWRRAVNGPLWEN